MNLLFWDFRNLMKRRQSNVIRYVKYQVNRPVVPHKYEKYDEHLLINCIMRQNVCALVTISMITLLENKSVEICYLIACFNLHYNLSSCISANFTDHLIVKLFSLIKLLISYVCVIPFDFLILVCK